MTRTMRQIRNIEVSSRCNLACRYCLHPIMPRAKVDMAEDVWQAALAHVRYYVTQGTQGELNLSLTGESTLHPDLPRFCREARAVLGGRRLQFTTNGKGLTEALVRALVPSDVKVCVTNHHAHLAGPAAALLAKHGLLRSISHDPVVGAQTWAGQVDWYDAPRPGPKPVCMMLNDGLGTIQADGTFVVCCMDGANETVFGTVFDPPGTLPPLRPWRLCPACWQRPPER